MVSCIIRSLYPASIIDRMSELNTVAFDFWEHLLVFFHVKLNFDTILKQYGLNKKQHFLLLTRIKTVVSCVMYYSPLSQCPGTFRIRAETLVKSFSCPSKMVLFCLCSLKCFQSTKWFIIIINYPNHVNRHCPPRLAFAICGRWENKIVNIWINTLQFKIGWW